MKASQWIGSLALVGAVAAVGVGLAAWKRADLRKAAEAAAMMPEPMEAVVVTQARDSVSYRCQRCTTTAPKRDGAATELKA